ncbi:HAD-IIA family hydrolase [Mycobacterium asiaticum]|uniref:HAD family hydrolase n=1 Tax=Mycobacterium asiaticum TaxID=1790 RepID=A0A1A3KGN8_MYCAS|nr:HAD-IIA family hydrolase [Mycobacterium asiaticum]OBJ83156.1 HAD family hydrolase [Mycobacterium asiaticum]
MPKTGSTNLADTKTIAQQYDCLLLDLDGTVFRGHRPTEGAVKSLDAINSRKLFVTNNASRSADEVAAHLRELGFSADSDDVVTSAQSAAHLLAAQLQPDAKVLVVGTEALADEIAAVGLRPVRRFDDRPDAVVQGLSMEVGWSDLAEATLAIRAGAVWVAANVDPTLPTERGLLPGNGSLVAAVRTATGEEPQVAGKPGPQLMKDAVGRGEFRAPLVVGDRLDTDIEGANAAGLPSLMVLTGVNSAHDAVFASPEQRPTYIGHDLRSLHQDAELLKVGPQAGWRVDVDAHMLTVSATDDDPADELAVVRVVAAAVWDAPAGVGIEAGDDQARDALKRWSLLA